MNKKKSHWAGAVFIALLIASLPLVIVLHDYATAHPGHFISKVIAFLSGHTDPDYLKGSALFLVIFNILFFVLVLRPMQVYGWKFWFAWTPNSLKAKNFVFYHNAILDQLAKAEAEERSLTSEELNWIQQGMIEMQKMDPESPFLTEINNKVYGTELPLGPETHLMAPIQKMHEAAEFLDEEDEWPNDKAVISPGRLLKIFGIGLLLVAAGLAWLWFS